MSSATARVVSDLLKAFAIILYLTARSSEVDQENLKPCSES